MIDFLIVLAYFGVILLISLKGKINSDTTADDYFLSSRNLPWYSIAVSTIATNIQGYQFLGMMGSAYLYGLAQVAELQLLETQIRFMIKFNATLKWESVLLFFQDTRIKKKLPILQNLYCPD